ncbi:1,4-alpha-glucan branching protein GlgB [Roseibium sp. HPY-6]|uniref:1,4-alpha-glucan branching protein GlgB n=1 Tax=Roseibium sp. HPY-6 TaxID=3229852 RepID=UPI00338FA2A1
MSADSGASLEALSSGNFNDPFSVLGPHDIDGKICLTVFHPDADKVEALDTKTGKRVALLAPQPGAPGVFQATTRRKQRFAYRLRLTRGAESWESEDAYRFGPVLGELDEYLIGEGSHLRLWEKLGAHVVEHEGTRGVHFAVWAPNAKRVSLVGDFNAWDGRRNAMRKCGSTGVWEIFMPGLEAGTVYKFELQDSQGNLLPEKADPFGFGAEHPPKTASVVRDLHQYQWQDESWLKTRGDSQRIDRPISIYEVHLGSWRRVPEDGNRPLSYLEHARELVAYAKEMGFTHIELLPVSEHPFDGSWGYQPVGLFAPTIRYGTLDEFRAFVDACHGAGLGVIIDWVPGHFPEDEHGLGRFDGTPLYEHADPREGWHPDWRTYIYNYGRTEVQNFLIANALYWMREHHVDGLRVDAVASMLYRDYSRADGEWVPNVHGGRENLEAIEFLKRANTLIYADMEGVTTVAEESTAFPGVSTPVDSGGLGFGFKWNMGWMNDTLSYMREDPVHRKYHHNKIEFGLHYAFSENFVLPLSHDEVVHGKGSILDRMPGDGREKFANLRAYYGFMWGHPGKKLLFMGSEFAQGWEWNHNESLGWHLLENGLHKGVQTLVRDLNRLYADTPALHELDSKSEGFQWMESNADESVFAWIRRGAPGTRPVLVVCNFTPVERSLRRIGVPAKGRWIERLNTDAKCYGGNGLGNLGSVSADEIASSGQAFSLCLTLPPLSTLIFECEAPEA